MNLVLLYSQKIRAALHTAKLPFFKCGICDLVDKHHTNLYHQEVIYQSMRKAKGICHSFINYFSFDDIKP